MWNTSIYGVKFIWTTLFKEKRVFWLPCPGGLQRSEPRPVSRPRSPAARRRRGAPRAGGLRLLSRRQGAHQGDMERTWNNSAQSENLKQR